MKKINSYILPTLALLLASCADGYEGHFSMEKPQSVADAERLAGLGSLKSAVDRDLNPYFKLGVSVSASDYASKGVTYSIALSNFNFVTDETAMYYSTIMDASGSFTLTPVTDMAIAGSPAVGAGPMLAYNALPKAWLENVIAPTFIKGDLASGNVSAADFDSEEIGCHYEMNNGSVATVTSDPTGGESHVLQVGSPDDKARNSYAIIKTTLADGLTIGDISSIGFDLYCPDANSQKRNFVAILNGVRKNYTGDTPDKRGCPLNTWARKLTLNLNDMQLPDDVRTSTELSLCLGPNVNNSHYYIDNITFTWQTGEPDKFVDKNYEEKALALADNFTSWATGIMEATAPLITEYVVLANPLSDSEPFSLRTAASEIECGNDTTGCFFFNDFMGDNYLKTATDRLTSAYTGNGGTGTPIFYVRETGLAGNKGKTERLVSQIASWSAAGAKIDGIAVELKIPAASGIDRADIANLFSALAATGKLIRLDNVSANGDAKLYETILSEYLKAVEPAKRGGIIFAGIDELWKGHSRTDAYEAVFNALCGQTKQ